MRRSAATTLLCVNGLLLVGMILINVLVTPSKPPPPDPVPKVRLGALVGQVEVLRHGSLQWVPAKVGDVLQDGDEIRTREFSEAALHTADASSVVVAASTSFVVGKKLVQQSTFELGIGQITAAIPQGSTHEYQFKSKGSDAVASTRQGEFSLSSDGKGTVIVDTQAGDVKLRAKGEEVVVGKGARSLVLPGKKPTQALPIPTSVALQVKWPPTKSDKTKATIVGSTSAGAMVMVNGVMVRADPDGKFALDVALREGGNQLIVNVTDSAGNTITQQSPEILVDTRPPDLKVDAKDIWK